MQSKSKQGFGFARRWRQALGACGLLLGLGGGHAAGVAAQEEPSLPPPAGTPIRASGLAVEEAAPSDARRLPIEEKHPDAQKAEIGDAEASTIDLRLVPAAPLDLDETRRPVARTG